MTIAAGFRYYRGLILAADTQHTYSKMLKVSRPKIVQLDFPEHKTRIGIAIAGFVDFALMAAEKIEGEIIHTDFSPQEIKDCIESVVLGIHEKHVYPAASTNDLSFDLLVGTWTEKDGISLLQTSFSGVLEVKEYGLIGIGLYLAQYLAETYHKHFTLDDAVTFVIDVFQKVKTHVDGCGGDTTILVIEDDGSWVLMPKPVIIHTETFTKSFDDLSKDFVRVISDLSMTNEDVSSYLDMVKDEVRGLREEQTKKTATLRDIAEQLKKQSKSKFRRSF